MRADDYITVSVSGKACTTGGSANKRVVKEREVLPRRNMRFLGEGGIPAGLLEW